MTKKRKVTGYGFKMASESWTTALMWYANGSYSKTKAQAEREAAKAKVNGDVPKSAKLSVFRVVVEEV